MQVTWAVQTNLLNARDVQAIEDACGAQGQRFLPLHVIPFSQHVPDVPTDAPAIFYGSARQTIQIAQHGGWHPGVFFSPDTFCYSAYIDALGARMLNADALMLSAEALAQHPAHLEPAQTYFVRPNGDDKSFAGGLMRGEDLVTWATKLVGLGTEIRTDAPMVIATPRAIESEWRLFMTRDTHITQSRYQHHGQIARQQGAPPEVLDFAMACAQHWTPDQAFVMDIARTQSGELKIIEFNGINSSGFYDASIPDVVQTLSDLAIKLFQAR